MLDNSSAAAAANSKCKSRLPDGGTSRKRSRHQSGQLNGSKFYSIPMQYTTAEVEQRLEEISEEVCDHSAKIAMLRQNKNDPSK